MTLAKPKTVVDSIIPLLQDDDGDPNPYGQKKSWHKPDGEKMADANSLFQRPAPKEPQPEPGDPSATSNEDPGEEHDYKKRWTDLKSYHDKQTSKMRQELEDLKKKFDGEQETPSVPLTVPETPDQLESFKKENPDLFAIMESISTLQAQKENKDVSAKLSEIEKRELKIAKEKAQSELRAAHKDLDQITSTNEFHDWAESQPEEIQGWIYKNPTNGALAIKAIDLYKFHTGKSEKLAESKTEADADIEDAASLVSTKASQPQVNSGKKIWTESEIKALSMDKYDQLEKEIDEAWLEGRVLAN